MREEVGPVTAEMLLSSASAEEWNLLELFLLSLLTLTFGH